MQQRSKPLYIGALLWRPGPRSVGLSMPSSNVLLPAQPSLIVMASTPELRCAAPRCMQVVAQQRQGYEFVTYVNPPSLMSVPAIWHAHVVSRRAPPPPAAS